MNLLFALGQTRCEHIITSTVNESNLSKQRQFLNDVAYTCDFPRVVRQRLPLLSRTGPISICFRSPCTPQVAVAEKVRYFLTKAPPQTSLKL